MFTREKKAKRYEQMRERRRAKFRKRLERMRPLLLFLQRSKKATVDALVGVGKKYGILRYPVIAVLAVFLFIYHLFYQTMICIKLQEKLARGVAFALTLCMVVTSVNVTALAVGSSGDENGQTAQTLVCGKDEHTHTDACYEKQLICGLEEDHVHTDECYETVLTCGKEEHTHTEACYAQAENANDVVASQSSDGTAVQAEDEVTFANGGYPYGKSMGYQNIVLVAELESGTAQHIEWQKSSDRNFSTYEVVPQQNSLTTSSSFKPEDGMWYRCVVNYNYKTKAIQAALPEGSVITNPTAAKKAWYLTNGYIAYTVSSFYFDILGKYEKTGANAGTYWVKTTFSSNGWAIYTSNESNPTTVNAVDTNSGNGNGGLSKLRVSFIPGESYGLNMEAFLQNGKQAFAFGCDTMLGNSKTSGDYSDQASLKAIKNQTTVSQVQMVGAETVSSAKVEDPSFVIKFNQDTPPTYYWLGHQVERKWWGQSKCDDYNSTNHTQYDENPRTAADSGMTMSWCNVAAGTGIKFSFYAGSVENTGAVIKANAKVSSTEITLTGLKTDYEYQLVDESGNPVAGHEGWLSANVDGTLTYSGLTPNTKYKVKSREKNNTTVETYVDVDATTAVDPTENNSASGGSSAKTEVVADYRTIKITNADASYSYCLQDEDGYELTQWLQPGEDNTVTFEGLSEATTYYLVAKTTDNNRSDRKEYTTLSRTYQVRFDANASGDTVTGEVPAAQSKTSGRVVVIPTTKLSRDGYTFLGWSTKKDAETADYEAGGIYSEDADATLYAVWYQKVDYPLAEDVQTYEYTGSTKYFYTKDKEGTTDRYFTVKYYVAGTDTEVSYVREVGTYDVKLTRAEDTLYKAYDKTLRGALVITKASSWTKKPTSLGSKPTSYFTNNDSGVHMTDGIITGVTSDMEYRAEGEDTYHPIDGTTIDNLADGTYYVRYKDNESHVAGPDSKITVGGGTQDDVAPNASVTLGEKTWKAFLNDITFGLLFQDRVTVQVAATDDGCGLGSLSYWIASEAKTLDEVKANTNWIKKDFSSDGKAAFDVEPSGEKVAYIKVEDKLGNAAYLSTDGMRIYRLDDTISVKNQSELAEAISAGYKKIEISESAQEVSITGDVTIPADVTLTISQDTRVKIADNVSLINNGKLVNNGTITGGSLTNNAILVNGTNGTIKTAVTNGADGRVSNNNQASWKNASGEYYGSFKDAVAASPVATEIIIDTNTTLPAESITISNGTKVTIKDGVKVTVPKDGILTIPAESTITNKGTIAVDQGGQLINQGKLLDGTLINQGTLVNSGIAENLVMDNAGIVENNDRIYGGDVTNEGTIKNNGTITNGTLTNQGTIINGANSNIKSPVANEGKGSVTNKNTASWKDANGNAYYGSLEEALTASPAATEITIESDVTLKAGETSIPNNVMVNIPEGVKVTVPDGSSLTLPENGAVKNKGTIEVEANGQVILPASSKIDNDGDIIVKEDGSLTNNGNITGGAISNQGTVTNKGTVNDSNVTNTGTWVNSGSLTLPENGSLSNTGSMTVEKDGQVILPVNSKTDNEGAITIETGGSIANNGKFVNNGSIENNGTIVNDGMFTNHGTIVNQGQIINNNAWSNDGQITGSGKLIGTDKKTVPENKPETPNNADSANTTDKTDIKNTTDASAPSAQQTSNANKKAKNTSGGAGNTENTPENTTSLANISYDEKKDQPITESTNISMGSGNVIVNIASIDENGESGADAIKGVILTNCENVIKACLTEEEIKSVENGEKIEIVLTVQKLETSVDKTDKKQIEKATTTMEEQIPGLSIGQYVDISVMKKIGSADWKKISKLNDEMEICIDVPDELKQDGRTYFIMRNHDGSCYLLDDQDDQADTITIRTGLFSTYAIMYTDTAASQWSQAVAQSTDEGAIRGVQNPVCHWHFMILALLVIFVVLLYVMRKSSLAVRLSMLAVNAVSGLAFAMVGTCNLDWICFILDMIVSIVALVLMSRMRQIKDKE